MDKSVLDWIYKKTKFSVVNIFLISVLSTIISLISVFAAKYTKNIVDCAVSKNFMGVAHSAVILLIIALFITVTEIFLGIYTEKTRAKIEKKLKTEIFSDIIEKEYEPVKKYHSGDLITRLFGDISIITDGVVTIIPKTISMFAGLIGSFVLLISIDSGFSLIFVLFGILIFAVAKFFRAKIKQFHKTLQENDAKTRSFAQETFVNLLTVKANDTNSNVPEKFKNLLTDFFSARLKKCKFTVFAGVGLDTAFDAGYLFALIWGAFGIFGGSITYGSVAATLQLVGKLQQPFAGLSGILPQYYAVIASSERIIEIESIPTDVSDLDTHKGICDFKAICVDNITFSYSDGESILENATVNVNKGEFVVIEGSSGIGKSTLMKIILGVSKDYTGRVFVELSDGSKAAVSSNTRKLFSYVPQGNMLFSGTIYENLTFMSAKPTKEELEKVLNVTCCSEFINVLPEKENTVIGENGVGLSEGQVQRLAIARALLKKAPILLLDESTSALDEETEARLLRNLKSLNNITVIIVSHKKSAEKVCDKKILIKDRKFITESRN